MEKTLSIFAWLALAIKQWKKSVEFNSVSQFQRPHRHYLFKMDISEWTVKNHEPIRYILQTIYGSCSYADLLAYARCWCKQAELIAEGIRTVVWKQIHTPHLKRMAISVLTIIECAACCFPRMLSLKKQFIDLDISQCLPWSLQAAVELNKPANVNLFFVPVDYS